jgi:hypothetical protein
MKMAHAITAEVIAIVNGVQNPLLTVTGLFVGMGVSVDMSRGVGDGDGPSVTVNVAVATPEEPVAVIVYTPGATCGISNIAFAWPATFAIADPMWVVSKVMLIVEVSGYPCM